MSYRDWIRERGSSYLALVLRLYVGGVFIYASMHKIVYTADFAESVASYQLVPFWAVNIVALSLPWTELFSGLLLVAGVKTRSAATIIAGMLCIFIMAVVINLLRGAPIGCGCFRGTEDPISWFTVSRDVIWLGMAIYLWLFDSALQMGKGDSPASIARNTSPA